jgi:NAD(P)H-flavin reductase
VKIERQWPVSSGYYVTARRSLTAFALTPSVVGDLAGARVDLKKGGLAVVRLEGAGGELAVLTGPRELALIAGGVGGVPIYGD